MVQLTTLAHELIAKQITNGGIVIDATCGNGHDTHYLAELVGVEGLVIACDLQQRAITATKQRCSEKNNIEYFLGDHAEILNSLGKKYEGKISAAMFNLGYLPGGEKSKTTQPDSTLPALNRSLQLLKSGGLISVLAYVGHPGGKEEAEKVASTLLDWTLSGKTEVLYQSKFDQHSTSPRLYIVQKI